jgi:alkanesulfonate monooxygenase SsuD/methylene tetrahydromethanopterin reductase-like flavin-dependent oxidoreductase (luciferase family)
MEVGLALPQFDWTGPVPWEATVATAQRAEASGFTSVWLADHLFLDPSRYGLSSGRADGFDPIVGLAGLARATSTVRLGTLVLCSQLRPAAIAAKMLATADRLSGGRVIVGIGAGWFEPEFEEAAVPFERPGIRVGQLEDTVRTMKAMWRGDPGAPPCVPGAATVAGPPIWVAGKGDKVIEVAARYADGFNHQGWTEEAGPWRFDAVGETCARVGRDPATLSLSALHMIGDPSSPDDLAKLRERLAAAAAAGATTVIVTVGALPFSLLTFDALERVASALP